VKDEIAAQVVEHAPAEPEAPAPVLVVLPDPEARVELSRPVLGHTPAERLTRSALEAGFADVYLAPGTCVVPEGSREVTTGEEVGRPALVVFEASCVHPALLSLMVEHPLESDERFTLYDDRGRPAGWFNGELGTIPATMPISEELDWPEQLGPRDIARLVYAEDRDRVEELILRGEKVLGPATSRWQRAVTLPTLRLLANSRRPLSQIELAALGIAVASGPLALLGTHPSLILSSACLLVGVHVSSLLFAARRLRRQEREAASPDIPGESLARATRPLAHAAAIAGMTYLLVSETARTSVAGLVLLAAGAGAVLFSLGHARKLLRRQPDRAFALPDATTFMARLGLKMPPWLRGVPLLELAVLIAALPGLAGPPWAVLAAGGLARLWRWFAGSGERAGEPAG
jgi:hypothetical protein